MSIQGRSVVGLAVAVLLVTAACGSTVPVQQQQAAQQAAEQGITDGGLGGGGLGTGTDGTGTGGTGGGSLSGSGGGGTLAGGGGTGTTGTGTGGTGSGGGTSTASGENGPGVTATTIKFGVAYDEDAAKANAQIAPGIGQINQRKAYEAMIAYENGNGGVNGRKIIPVFHAFHSISSGETSDQEDAEACAQWTQDDPVFASDGGYRTESGLACLEKAGTAIIASDGLTGGQSKRFYSLYPHAILYDDIDLNAMSLLYVEALWKQGYFTKDAKIGLMTINEPERNYALKNSLIPAMKSHGLEFSDIAYIDKPQSNAEAGNEASEIASAAVRFKGEGITHVMFLDSHGFMTLVFAQNAERQQYAPRYGLNTLSGNTGIADLLKQSSADHQFHNAISVGWGPTLDVHPEDLPAWGKTAQKEKCYSIMKKGGINMTDANSHALAEGVCDSVWSFQALAESAGSVINQDTWLQGLGKAASIFQPTSGVGFRVDSGNHDGNARYAWMKFFDKCTCFKYTSDLFSTPS
jgi:hypothetical protein